MVVDKGIVVVVVVVVGGGGDGGGAGVEACSNLGTETPSCHRPAAGDERAARLPPITIKPRHAAA